MIFRKLFCRQPKPNESLHFHHFLRIIMVSESLNFWISFILFFVFFEKIFKIKCLKGLFWVRAPHNLAFESFPSASDLLRLGLSSHKVPTPANKWIILNMMNLKYILSLPSDWFNTNSEFYVPVISKTWTRGRPPDWTRTLFWTPGEIPRLVSF